jgi:large subunit GTPase 1
MVLAKSKNTVGLGNSLMNDRFGRGKGSDMRRGNFQPGIQRTGTTGETVSKNTQSGVVITF